MPDTARCLRPGSARDARGTSSVHRRSHRDAAAPGSGTLRAGQPAAANQAAGCAIRAVGLLPNKAPSSVAQRIHKRRQPEPVYRDSG